MKKFLLIAMLMAIMPCVLALSVTPLSWTASANSGQTITKTFIFSTGVNETANLRFSTSGEIANWMTLSISSVNLSSDSSANLLVVMQIPESAQTKTYTGTVLYDSVGIEISIDVINIQQQQACNIDVFPTVLSNVKVTQGATKTKQILLTVPSCFKDRVDFRSVNLESDEPPIQLGELSLGSVTPGQSIQIPLVFDATNSPTGTYYETMNFLIYNSSGNKIQVPSVSISLTVTAGISPITNQTFLKLPVCSLDANMQLNQTYTLICTDIDPNLRVEPQYNEFLYGISVDEAGGKFTYNLKPTKIGNTNFTALYTYKGSPIGSPFIKEIRITSAGLPQAGTNLKFDINPQGWMTTGGDIHVLVLDEKTNSVVPNAVLYLNGQQVNNSFTLNPNTYYELRASASGYLDAFLNFTISPQEVRIILDPLKGDYLVGESINITTDPEGASLLLDGAVISSPLKKDVAGTYSLEAVKEGFISTKKNITFVKPIGFGYVPPIEFVKLNKEITLELNQNASWEVTYQKDAQSTEEKIASGFSNTITFTPNKKGIWNVKSGEVSAVFDLTKIGFTWKGWYWYIIGVIVLIFIIRLIPKGSRAPLMPPSSFRQESVIPINI